VNLAGWPSAGRHWAARSASLLARALARGAAGPTHCQGQAGCGEEQGQGQAHCAPPPLRIPLREGAAHTGQSAGAAPQRQGTMGEEPPPLGTLAPGSWQEGPWQAGQMSRSKAGRATASQGRAQRTRPWAVRGQSCPLVRVKLLASVSRSR
jgi:hypothetical protein